jgi:hypothetical protein
VLIKNYTYINEGDMRQPGYQLLTAAGELGRDEKVYLE